VDFLRASLSGVFLGLLFYRLGLPGGAVVGAMLGTGLVQLLASPAPIPKGLDLAVQLAAGVLPPWWASSTRCASSPSSSSSPSSPGFSG